jgi:outer membrane protein assembly factor BamB
MNTAARRLMLALALAAAAPAADEWPEFRGPTGQGTSTATGLPIEWSATKNVVWKQAVPGAGWSSPALSRGQIFLTAGLEGSGGLSLHALCLDAATGRVVWDREVFPPAENSRQTMHGKNSPASPTPLVEADRVYVHFGPHGTACLDRAGKILWRNNRLGYDGVHGNGGSPALVDDELIFSSDGAAAPFVVALDKLTGEVKWQVARTFDVRQTFSFSTPLLISVAGRAQVISPGSGGVTAHDPADGRELWRVRYGGGYSVVPRPVLAQGLLFLGTGYNRADLLAIRPGGSGDVTDTHIAWRTSKGAPLTPSVVAVGEEIYVVNDAGIASCFDAKTGTVHWQERIDGNYSASPVAAEGRIYFQNETGTGTVVAAGRKFAKLATNTLPGRTLASYGVTDGALFIRTDGHLYRIGAPAPATPR